MAKIVVLGSGIMATAMCWPATTNGNEMHLVGTHLDREIIDSIQKTGVHPNLDLKVPENVYAYQLEDAAKAFEGADVVISGVNSFGVYWAGQRFKDLVKPGQNMLVITKGMDADEEGNMRILPEVLKAEMGDIAKEVTWSAIVGPAIAGEVAVGHDTSVVFTGENQETLDYLAGLFRTDRYHVWTSTDFVGHEVGAATKNIYAFGAGFGAGLLMKEGKQNDRYVRFNYSAAFFAQGNLELLKFIEMFGGKHETGLGLAGVGDMYVTSAGGRNVKAGTYVGSGVPFSEVRDSLMKGVTLEGVAAIRVIGAAMEKKAARGEVNLDDFPALTHLYGIIARDEPLNMPWSKFFGGEK